MPTGSRCAKVTDGGVNSSNTCGRPRGLEISKDAATGGLGRSLRAGDENTAAEGKVLLQQSHQQQARVT